MPIRTAFIIAVALMCSCGPIYAQSSMIAPGLGITSPLGTLGSSSTSGAAKSTRIPLGATEINPTPAPMVGGTTIPLGATEMNSAGTSPLITVSPANPGTTSCVAAMTSMQLSGSTC